MLYTAEVSGSHGATFVSENVKSQMGYTPEDFLRDPDFWANHIHPDDKPRIFEQLPRLFEKGRHIHEYRFLHKNGHYRWMRDELNLSYDTDGNPRKIIGYWIDVTEQKAVDQELEWRVEERTSELRNSERLLKQASKIAGLGYYLWDWKANCYDYVSEDIARIYGMSVDELLANYNSQEEDIMLVHPDDRERVSAFFAEPSKLTGYYEIDYRIVRPDGEERYVHEIGEPVFDHQGQLIQSIGILQDFTERAEMELSIRQSEAKLKLAAETARLGYWHFDEVSDEYLDISYELANIFGYTVEEYLRRFRSLERDMELVHPEDRAAVYEAYASNISHGLEYRVLHKDGGIRYVRETWRDIADDSGNFVESVGALQDITAHRRVLQQLEKSEKHYSSLFAQLPAGVQEQDYSSIKNAVDKLLRQGIKDIREYLEANPAVVCEMVRGIKVTGVNKALLDIHHCSSKDEYIRDEDDISTWWNDRWAAYYAAEISTFCGPVKTYEAECIDIRSDHSEFDVRLVSCVVSGYEDSWGRVLSIVEDISEKKQREITLLETMERAEQANRAKSEFLSSMSHELRTPMNAVLGFAQLLELDRTGPGLSEKQKKYVKHILNSGEHLVELIDQVLELSKIEAGKLSIKLEQISPQNIIDESLTLVRTQAQQGGIEILDHIDRSDLPLLWTDGTRLKQVLVNLLTNAIKYNREKGTVILNCQETSERMLRISVADTGIGIAKEKQHNLFMPFERLGREGGVISGTGIGLTITRQIIELLGGNIDFQSKEGEGSTFWIDIPVNIVQAPSAHRFSIIPSAP